MSNFNKNIDKLVSRILNEEIENKVKELSKNINESEWTEIEMDEELKGGQKKLDVAEPKGKLDAEDFKKLRSKKKETKEQEEMDEWFFFDDEEEESTPGDYEGDEDEEEEAEELSAQEPTYVGKGLGNNPWHVTRKPKMIGSFDDEHGWFDDIDAQSHPDAISDYDEEEFPDFQSLMSKHGKNQRWFAPKDGERFFKSYQDKFGGKPFRVRTPKGLEEDAETEEGNAFSGALAKAKESGEDSFEVDGKKYSVKEARDKFDGRKSKVIGVYSNIKKQREMKEGGDKWIQDTKMKKGALHKKLGIPEEDKIPQAKLKSLKKELMKKGEGDKKLSAADSKLLKQVNLALTLKSVKESTNSLRLTEDELIDMIENIVMEQKVKDKAETSNIPKKEAEGLKKTNKVLDLDKKENDDYAKEVVTKMKDYMKDMFMGGKGYEENPDDFPQSNYDMEKEHNEMKYHPSDAVEEYIEAFAYPGMTNLVYDEIKPDDEMIDKQIKGDAKNGNAITSKDGKALGNVSKRSEKVGDRFKKNFDDNLYGAEQMEVSYNRQPQPVDVAGTKKQAGSLKSIRPGSAKKAQNIMSKLESTEDKASKMVSEEMSKMKNLISYDRKTQ
jgi:hypothetical protein